MQLAPGETASHLQVRPPALATLSPHRQKSGNRKAPLSRAELHWKHGEAEEKTRVSPECWNYSLRSTARLWSRQSDYNPSIRRF